MVLEQRLRIDIASSANQLDLECAEILQPAPKGIYLKTRLEPVMVDGNTYYVRKGDASIPVTDINQVTENVYDESNKLIIPKTYLLKKEKYLSNESFLPYRACKIIECMAEQSLDELLAWRTAGRNWVDRMEAHIKPEVLAVETPSEFATYAEVQAWEERKDHVNHLRDEFYQIRDRAYQLIKQELELFVGKLSWHMYYVKLEDTTLIVERFCDYRVHLWELEHGNKFRGIPEEEE